MWRLYFTALLLVSCTTSFDQKRAGETQKKSPQETRRLEGAQVDAEVLKATPGAPIADPVEYRQSFDDEEERNIYREAQRAWEDGQQRQAEALYAQYIAESPTGQYIDVVSLRLAGLAMERHDYRQAALHGQRVAELDPPSRMRAQGWFVYARAQMAMGNAVGALGALAQIDFREVPVSQREEIFAFWSEAAAAQGRWLEATLAAVKAYWETRNSQKQREYAELVRDQIDRRLVEGELQFVLKEYPNRFPSQELRLRLATLYLARGDRSQAETLLSEVLAAGDTRSDNYRQALELLERLNTYQPVAAQRVGLLVPLSGRQEPLGRAIYDGLRLALHETQVEVVLADTGPTQDSLRQAYERLILEDRVMLVVGPLAGDASEMVAQWSVQYGVPNIVLSSRPGLLEKGNYVFRNNITPEKQVRALVRYSQEKLNAQRFGVLFPQDNFGSTYAQEYVNAVRILGGEVTAAESYDPSQTDFKIQIDNMVGTAFPNFRRSEMEQRIEKEEERLERELTARERSRMRLPPWVDFEVLFIPDTYRALGQIIPALLYADVKEPILLGPATWRNPRLLERAGQYMNGALFVDVWAEQRPSSVTRGFVEQFQISFGSRPSALNALGYDVGLALKAAYTSGRSAPTNREELRSRLEYLGEVPGAMARYMWDSERDALAELQLFRAQRGRFEYQGSIGL